MKKFLLRTPTLLIAIPAILFALAPFAPEPHLLEKLKMLFAGNLHKPIDIFDLFMHGTPLVLLFFKLYYLLQEKKQSIKTL